MNYLFTAPTIAFTAGERVRMDLVEGLSYYPYPALSAAEYAVKIHELLNLYPWEIQLTQLNLLDSHDTARLLSVANGDKASVELATLLLLTFPGAPSIYYGDEVGLAGELDPDSRRGFPFQKAWDEHTLNYHKQLIALRHQYRALKIGGYQILFAEGLVYGFARIFEDEEVIVVVNSATQSVNITMEAGSLKSRPEKVLYGHAELSWEGENLTLNLPERSGCILAVA